jgi:Ca2+-binding EF-hand superfamily protein
MAKALKIEGREGKYSHINGKYEPLQTKHNDRPCWVYRSVKPAYIFHSGKGRWCISKTMDDGSRCWAFLNAPEGSSDPSALSGSWTLAEANKEWKEDPKVTCQSAVADNDQFVQLRLSLDVEMRKYGLIDRTDLKKLWRKLDYNGNGIVSLAEIDKLCVEQVAGGIWPEWLNNKPALMRAYKKTLLTDGDGDDWVEKQEFSALLLNIFWFNKLWQIFKIVADDGTGADRRMDVNEFIKGAGELGLKLSESEARDEFAKMDTNGGGQVLFVEFCAYVRKRVNPDDDPNFDADIVSGEKCGKVLRKSGGSKVTVSHFANKKCFKDFDDLEKIIKDTIANKRKLHQLWSWIDYNGNNIVSLAEIDKLIVEKYPLLNHKPALMRAYKMTTSKKGGGDGDDWVEKKEFTKLLGNLFYFNKIFWVYDQIDNDKDRRLDFDEFKQIMSLVGAPMGLQDAKAEFAKVDKNGGGVILFDEFCLYFTEKQCPQSLTELVG